MDFVITYLTHCRSMFFLFVLHDVSLLIGWMDQMTVLCCVICHIKNVCYMHRHYCKESNCRHWGQNDSACNCYIMASPCIVERTGQERSTRKKREKFKRQNSLERLMPRQSGEKGKGEQGGKERKGKASKRGRGSKGGAGTRCRDKRY